MSIRIFFCIAAKWDFWNEFQPLWRVIKLILLSKALKNLALKLFSSIIKIENVTNKNLSRVVTSSPVVVRCLLELRKVTQECNCKEERRDNNLKMSHFSFSSSDLFSALWPVFWCNRSPLECKSSWRERREWSW